VNSLRKWITCCLFTEAFVQMEGIMNFREYHLICLCVCVRVVYTKGWVLISLRLYKENKLRNGKNAFTLHILPLAPHTYDFVVLTSLTHPRKLVEKWSYLER
jgi:hypothetical protein